jgi:RNA polymerase sigma-70 factor (ECF subfamily)
LKGAATVLLEGYGRELLGFLMAHERDEEVVSEVFSMFAEDLWRGLRAFRWDSSARTWSYALLRHASIRYGQRAGARRKRHVTLSRAGPLSQIAQRVRTATLPAARTEARNRFAQLRESLPREDQMLLVLRVNRELGWKEIAQVMTYDGKAVPAEVLEREAARLRKRFQLAKEQLRRLAVEEGIAPSDRDRESAD